MTQPDVRPTRRSVLKAAAALAAAPYFVPSTVLGRGVTPPSDRITLACIGTGGQGCRLTRRFLAEKGVQFLAVADLDDAHRATGRDLINTTQGNTDCQAVHDYRELLARDDIDAVIVATPDHWHALAAVHAAQAGMDIYCEKPLSNSVGEGRAIVEAVKAYDRVLQVGSHERSTPGCRLACNIVGSGRLGKVHTVRVNLPTDQAHHLQAKAMLDMPPAEPVPPGFDYDAWLGHTARKPYTPGRCHFWWRFNLAYGGGEMTDRGAHVLDIAQLGLGFDETGPVRVEARGKRHPKSLYNVFWDYDFTNTYADGTRIIGTSATGPRGLKFEGEDGWVFVHIHGGKLEASEASLIDPDQSFESPLPDSPGHIRNFLDCVRSRQTPLAPAEAGHRTATLCHLNNIAMKLGRPLAWDPEKEQVPGDEAANALLMPKMREPFVLPSPVAAS